MSTPSQTLDLCKILSQSRHIIKSQVHHFQALSVLFLLPFSFSIIVYPTLQTSVFKSQPDSPFPTQILINLLNTIFATLFFICAVGTISYSTFHGFCGTPVELTTSLKSVFHSFFPLVSTLIIQELIQALMSFPFFHQDVPIYGSKSFYNSNSYYMAFIIRKTLAFLLTFLYVQMNWILASVVAVVESKWGLKSMRRSSQLVKGMKGIAYSMVLPSGLTVGGFMWGFCATRLRGWAYILYMMGSSLFLTMVLLLNMVANVVLYVHRLEMHGEVLPSSSVEEFPLLK